MINLSFAYTVHSAAPSFVFFLVRGRSLVVVHMSSVSGAGSAANHPSGGTAVLCTAVMLKLNGLLIAVQRTTALISLQAAKKQNRQEMPQQVHN